MKQGSHGLTEREEASTGPASICEMSSLCVMAVSLVFMRDSYNERGVSLVLLPTLETFSLLLGCFVQPWYEDFCFVLVCLVLCCLAVISQVSALFWRGNRRGSGSGKRKVVGKLEGVKGVKTVVGNVLHDRRIYFQIKNIFKLKSKIENKTSRS